MNERLKLKLAVAGLLACVAGTAVADPRPRSGVEYARVVDVTPIVRQVRVETPARECWQETEYRTVRHEARYYDGRRAGSAVPTIAGGILGGVIGSQFGSGSGRDAMTAVGVLVGASVASEAARNEAYGDRQVSYERRPVTVERCQTTVSYQTEERIEGYRVTYVYAGREYHTTMASPPGNRIPVRVTVVPTRHR
ncbi:glycine zipper 2TM domain-containing protein [Thioalkalivibrio sp. XN8]|uniref:glycine zipper 2TM domain-containing protein n=1 Tax=Thioalkalivibrio sp. XN8 TaxID=2712863 RepID=UPI001F0E58EE|nr:glycine zipper 2TM domain-containing protein [Thioalkalivibrio sp. XN8]